MEMQQLLGSNPLAMALKARGQGLGALAQQTPSSTNFQPDEQVPVFPPPMDKGMTPSMGPMPPQGAPGSPQTPPQANSSGGTPTGVSQVPTTPATPSIYNTEANKIIDALSTRLNAVTKSEQKEKRKEEKLSERFIPKSEPKRPAK